MNKKVICMIPARIGSQRFLQKNLAMIEEKPILSWGIEAAQKSGIFDEIIINGDHAHFKEIAESYGLKFHQRNKKLSSNNSKSDDVIFDFLNHYKCDYVIWFNAIAPLQTIVDIKGFVETLTRKEINSLFSVKSEYIQSLFKNSPINFSITEKFSRTQDLIPISTFIPSMMGWESKTFKETYLKNKFSFFCGTVGYYEVKSKLSTLVVKNEDDFRLIRSVIEGFSSYNNKVVYYKQNSDEEA